VTAQASDALTIEVPGTGFPRLTSV